MSVTLSRKQRRVRTSFTCFYEPRSVWLSTARNTSREPRSQWQPHNISTSGLRADDPERSLLFSVSARWDLDPRLLVHLEISQPVIEQSGQSVKHVLGASHLSGGRFHSPPHQWQERHPFMRSHISGVFIKKIPRLSKTCNCFGYLKRFFCPSRCSR